MNISNRRQAGVGVLAFLGAATLASAMLATAGGDRTRGLSIGAPVVAPPRSAYELAVSRVVTGNPPRREIVLVDLEGTRARPVPTAPVALSSRVSWSPDGTQLVFAGVSGRDQRREQTDIFVIRADGSGTRRLTETGRAFAPIWSPDGRTIVFAQAPPSSSFPAGATLWAVAADGGEPRELTEPAEQRIDLPGSFAPDGSRLAFTRMTWSPPGEQGRVANTSAIYVLDVRSLDLNKVAERAADPAFDPTGEKLAFVSDRDENGELSYGDVVFYANELYVSDADGGGARRLTRTHDLNEGAPAWSPDGRLIAYQRGSVTGNAEGSIVLVARADGSCVRRVAFDPGLAVWYRAPAWRPGKVSGQLPCRPSRPPRPLPVASAGNLSLAAARRFRPLGLYWVGDRFGEFILSSISQTTSTGPRGRGPVVDVSYGGFDLQHWPACVRVPSDIYGGNEGTIGIRGLRGVFFERGTRLELVTGKTTLVIFGRGRAQTVRVARALRPLNPAVAGRSRRGRLPVPVPGALAGRLRCP